MLEMSEVLRFDGRVAIVTGAGGQEPSLGVGYARLLASRGAKVVVNDLGVGPDGTGALAANAEATVQEIRDAGGEAVADTHNVADPAEARGAVQTALDTWGRIDILVNNAGVVFFALFEEISENDIRRILDTHLYGHIWMSRAVWPHMKAAGYGRIVNISSRSMFSNTYLSIYGAAKAGVLGLTHGLAVEGARSGIQVNVVAPRARTRKQPYLAGKEEGSNLDGSEKQVDQVAQVVAFLCHERCDLNGAFLWASAGQVREYRMYESLGFEKVDLTVEDVHTNLGRVRDQTGAVVFNEGRGPERFDTMTRRPYHPR
jgi:NAD(P)-dependent dehydrogenase (short-subunit alcohol dehydrogenase family)